jgi:hypothetical protein
LSAVDQLERIEQRLIRLDARARNAAAPGQMGLFGGGAGTGQPCGQGHIAADLTCHKGGGITVPRGSVNVSALGKGGSSGQDMATRLSNARQRLRESIAELGGMGEEDAALVAEFYLERPKAGGAGVAKADPVTGQFDVKHGAFLDRKALQRALVAAKAWKASKQPPPAAAHAPQQPPAKPQLDIWSANTSQKQAELARQQQQAAAAAGDVAGAAAWKAEERTVERNRVETALSATRQSQQSLFGVTEYDETMPLFRRDSDPTAALLNALLGEQLEGAQVLDWARPRSGIHAGRLAADGLIYRFRTDGQQVAYRPAWDGLSEAEWEARSDGFLQARDPSARVDFKKVRFEQRTTKRKCSIGYSCGRSCIAMAKECLVTPSSAIGKQRLRALQALAKEGGPEFERKAAEVVAGRHAKAVQLKEERNVGQLKKLLADPKVAEMVRTGKVPEASGKRGRVRDVSPDEIEVDAKRFQYKLNSSATGEVGSLSGVKKWDPNLAGVISVWEDPADGKTYVINGHNRLALARRMGAEEITVRYLDAPDAAHARAIGAMQNIAEGQGTEIDAAKFFRDTGIRDLKAVEAAGLPLSSGKAAKGLALQALPDGLFQAVVQGDMTINRGAIIGGSGLSPEKQEEVFRLLNRNASMTDTTLREYVQAAFFSEQHTQGKLDILGAQVTTDNLLERSQLSASLITKLKKEKRLFGLVSQQRAAELLRSRAGNQINVEESEAVSDQAALVLGVFNKMKNATGPVSDALNAAANRVKAGESKRKVGAELEKAVMQGVEEELRRLGLNNTQANPNEELGASLFDSAAARLDAIEARLARLDVGPGTGQACGDGHIAAGLTCHKGSGGVALAAKEPIEKRLPKQITNRWTENLPGRITATGVVALDKPIAMNRYSYTNDKGELVEGIRQKKDATYEVEFVNQTNMEGSAQLREGVGKAIGVDLSGSLHYDAGFLAGLDSREYGRAPAMTPEAGRVIARAVKVEIDEILSTLPDNTLITCNPWTEDGLGESRRKLYQRAGFVSYSTEHQGLAALVRGGKLVKPETLGITRRDAAEEIDLEWLVFELTQLGAEGAAMDSSCRLDAIEARLIRLDKNCVKGKACGNSCVPKTRNCAKPAVQGPAPPPAASKKRSKRRKKAATKVKPAESAPAPAAAAPAAPAAPSKPTSAAAAPAAAQEMQAAAKAAGKAIVQEIAGPKLNMERSSDLRQYPQKDKHFKATEKALEAYTGDHFRVIKDHQAKRMVEAGYQVDAYAQKLAAGKRTRDEWEEGFVNPGKAVDLIERFVARAPKYEGEIARGMVLNSNEEALQLIEQLSSGNAVTGTMESWSAVNAKDSAAMGVDTESVYSGRMAAAVMDNKASVVIRQKNKYGASVAGNSTYDTESEVLQPAGVRYRVLSVTEVGGPPGRNEQTGTVYYDVEVEAIGYEPMPRRVVMDSAGALLEQLEAQLERLDARVKQAPGQMGLDLSGGAGTGQGQPCGRGHISPDFTCHKNGGAAVAGTAGSAPEQPLSEMRAEVARLKGESDAAHKVYSEAVSRYRGYSSETWDRTREQEESYAAMKAAEPIAKATNDAYHRLNNKLFEREQAIAPVTRKRAHTGLFKLTGEVMTNDGAQTMLQGFNPSSGALGQLQREARLHTIGPEHDDSDAREKSHIPDMPFWEAYDHRRRFFAPGVNLSAKAAEDLRTQLVDEEFRETAPGRYERSVATTERQQLPYGGYNRDYVKKVELDGFEAVDEMIQLPPGGTTASYRRIEHFSNHERFLPDHHGPSLGELKYRGDVYTFHAFSDGQFGQAYRNKAHKTDWMMADSEAALRERFEGYQEEGQTEVYHGIGQMAAMGGKIVNIKPAKVLKPWRADGLDGLEARFAKLEALAHA